MLGLIKKQKVSMAFRWNICHVTMQGKMRILNGLISRKEWKSSLVILPQVLVKKGLCWLPSLIGYMQCLTVKNFLAFNKWLMGWSCQHSHPSYIKHFCSITWFWPILTTVGKGKRCIIILVKKICEICITTHQDIVQTKSHSWHPRYLGRFHWPKREKNV